MDRRNFTKFAMSGLAFSFLSDSIGRAAVPVTAPLPAAAPSPAKPIVQPIAPKPYASLLEKAKAALDRHGDAFTLRDRVAIADFAAPSKELRFHVVDLIGGWRMAADRTRRIAAGCTAFPTNPIRWPAVRAPM